MNIYALSSLVALIVNSAIGIFVYLKNKNSTINRLFALFISTTVLWISGCLMESSTYNESFALFWDKILYTGLTLFPATCLHFTTTVIGVKKDRIIKITYLISSFFVILNFSYLRKYFIYGVERKYPFRFISEPAIGWYIFIIFFMACALYWIYLTWEAYRASSGHRRTQMKYLLTAWLIGSFTCFMYLLLVFNVATPPIDNFTGIVFAAILAYAIVKHQLMEIEVILKKTLIFAGLFAVVFAVLVLPTLIVQEFIIRKMGLSGRLIGFGISTILIVLILRPLETFLIRITDKFLFQKKYDYKELLKTFTGEVLTVLDLTRLVRLTTYKLADIIKLISCGILLFDDKEDGYKLIASYGIKEKNIVLTREDTLASFMERTRTYLSTRHTEKDYAIPEDIIKDMNRLKVELAIPLILHDDMIGILTLGKKKSDEPYTQDDMDILLPLARTLAIAITNAKLFEELSKTQAEAAQREKMAVIGTLSAGINHEICNPLGIARGQCEAFLLNYKEGLYKDKSEKELLDKAVNIMNKTITEIDRATAVTKRLSAFAKPIKELKADEVVVKDEVHEVMTLVGHELKLEKIDFVEEIPKDLPRILADRKQVQEIFFNLIRNAGQAIGENGKIIVRAKKSPGNKVLVEIEDTGHGIPEDKLDVIFNPFYTTKEPGKGTGLGLFIVRQVIEKNRGRISVRSKVGVGTTFTLEFQST